MKRLNRIKGEVRKEQIRIADTLSIVTTNSTYKFFVIDPERFYGMLVGGDVGQEAREAYVDRLSLRVGSKAHVIFPLPKGYRSLITSTVQVVIHLKAETADEVEESLPASERVTAKLPRARVTRRVTEEDRSSLVENFMFANISERRYQVKKSAGFTLIEFILRIAIAMGIAATALPAVQRWLGH